MTQDFMVCSWPKEWISYSIVHPSILIWMYCNLYEIYYFFSIFTFKFIALCCRLVAAKHMKILQDYGLVWSLEKFYKYFSLVGICLCCCPCVRVVLIVGYIFIFELGGSDLQQLQIDLRFWGVIWSEATCTSLDGWWLVIMLFLNLSSDMPSYWW
jgi:hypothetical protein